MSTSHVAQALDSVAALYVSWLRRDPVAVVRFARDLYEHGRARLGPRLLMPSRGLREHPYGGTERARGCPPADWMLLAALRDATNRVLPYSRPGGLREPPAAITMPGAVRSWLTGTGCFTEVVDETVLVRRPGLAHASGLVPGPDEDVFLLIAQEMFFAPRARWRRARNRVVSLVPNHWVLLRSPVTLVGDEVRFAFWSWGRVQVAGPSRVEFERCYHGALRAVGKTLAGLERAT